MSTNYERLEQNRKQTRRVKALHKWYMELSRKAIAPRPKEDTLNKYGV
jgi:hypothetical protein